jgi:competence ComEA-like helix-hairpin-helix protein
MFNLTDDEKRVILFLIGTVLVGIGINFFIKLNSPVEMISCFGQDIGKIDLNSSDKNLLTSIPGIGMKLAQRIIEYRQEQGGFSGLEELRKIKGITNYKYEKIKGSFIIR